MDNRLILLIAVAVNTAAAAAVALAAPRPRALPGGTLFVWMALLPGFGPLTGWFLLHPPKGGPTAGEWQKRNMDMHRDIIAWSSQSAEVVPLEEALLMNDPHKRRVMMMNMLRSDPEKYKDVLMVARFNDDPETAHYATATLMELQWQMQMEIQHRQQQMKDAPDDSAVRDAYISILNGFCESGFIEGQALRRERLTLADALRSALERWTKPEWLSIAVRNCLVLEQGQEAREYASRMLLTWPQDERSWLETMRVCAQTHDQAGMRTLLQKASETPVDWTGAGQERLKYWMGKLS